MVLEKEGDSHGMQRSDLSFCHNAEKANLLATAVSARVDIYKLIQPAAASGKDEEEEGQEEIKPI